MIKEEKLVSQIGIQKYTLRGCRFKRICIPNYLAESAHLYRLVSYEQFHITNTSIHLIQIFPEAFLQYFEQFYSREFFNAIHSGGQEGLNLAILLLILRCSIAQPNKLKNQFKKLSWHKRTKPMQLITIYYDK